MRFSACRPMPIPTRSCRSDGHWAISASSAAGRGRTSSTATAGVSPTKASRPNKQGETDMPRVPPITGKSDVPAEYHVVVDDVIGVFGQIRGPFSMLLHSPKLAEKMLGLVKFNRDESIVEPQLRSVGILASVREREAAYVWAAQVGAARRAELPESTIAP